MEQIISLNIDKREAAFEAAIRSLARFKPSLLLLQDVPLSKKNKEREDHLFNVTANDYKIYFQDENEINMNEYPGGNLIIAKSDLSVTPIIDPNAKDWMKNSLVSVFGVLVRIKGEAKIREIPVFSLYAKPHTEYKELEFVFDWMKFRARELSTFDNVIILGDVNSHHMTWSTPETRFNYRCSYNPTHLGGLKVVRNRLKKLNRGKGIIRFCKKNRLKILNRISEGPTFSQPVGDKTHSSYIDVAILGSQSVYMLPVFTVIDIESDTFHKAISLSHPSSANASKETEHVCTKKISRSNHLRSINVQSAPLLNDWRDEPFAAKVDRLNRLSEIVVGNLDKSRESITRLSKKSEHLTFRFNRRMKRACTRSLRLFSKKCKLIKIKAKDSSAPKKPRLSVKLGRIRRLERSANNKVVKLSNLSIKKAQDKNLTRPSTIDKLDRFVSKYYVNRENIPGGSSSVNRSRLTSELDKITHISDVEILEAFNMTFPRRESYPHSRIDHLIFRDSYKHIKKVINEICKISLWCAVVPKICQSVEGHLVPKASKNGFRIVHRSKPLLALLEKIVEQKFKHLLIESGAFNLNVYNQPLYSSEDVFVGIHNEYIKFRNFREESNLTDVTISIYKLDIKSAFDRVNQRKLIDDMYEFIDNPICCWLEHYLTSRKISIRTNEGHLSSEHPVTSGIFQGSPMASCLWIYLMQSLQIGYFFENHWHSAFIYFDDIYITYIGRDAGYIQRWFLALETYLKSFDLEFAHEKCSVFSVTKKHIFNSKLMFNGKMVEHVDELEVLGLKVTKKDLKLTKDRFAEMVDDEFLTRLNKLNYFKDLKIPKRSQKIRSLIKTEIIEPILSKIKPALGHSAIPRQMCENGILRSIKEALDISQFVEGKLIMLIFGLNSVKYRFVEWVIKRMIACPIKHILEAYKTLLFNAYPELIEEFDLEQIIPSLCRNFTAECIYPNPADLVVTKNSKPHDYWALIGESSKRAHLLRIEQKRVISVKRYAHRMIDKSYFHELVALFDLFGQQKLGSQEKHLLLDKNDRVYMDLTNMRNHDWRILELRKLIKNNNWTIVTTRRKVLCNLLDELGTESREKGPFEKLCIPNVDDHIGKLLLTKKLTTFRAKDLDDNHTFITRALCDDVEIWSNVDILTIIRSDYLLCLGGRHFQAGKSESTKLELGEMPVGCTDDECANNNRSNTLLHRLFDCPRYNKSRIELKKSLRLEHLTTLDGNLSAVLKDFKKMKLLLGHIVKIMNDSPKIRLDEGVRENRRRFLEQLK